MDLEKAYYAILLIQHLRACVSLQARQSVRSSHAVLILAKPSNMWPGILLQAPSWQLFKCLGFPYMILQFITYLNKDTLCAMQTDKDMSDICFQIVDGFKQGIVNAPSFLIVKSPQWSGQNLQVRRVQAW